MQIFFILKFFCLANFALTVVLRISHFASFAEQCAQQIFQFVTSKDFRNVLLVEKLDIASIISLCAPAARCRRATSINMSVCFFMVFFAVLFLIESNFGYFIETVVGKHYWQENSSHCP